MDKKDIIASVVMGVYNDETFIEQSMNSIISQLTDDMELVVVDDCSSDKTQCILQKYANADPRINLIINSENQGVGYCAYIGVKEAKGKYIIRMDSDDISFPDRFQKQIQFLEENSEIDIVGAFAIEIDENNNKGIMRTMPITHDEIVNSIWACPIIQPAVAFRREKIILAGNYNPKLRRRIDYELWFRCLASGLRFTNIPEPLVYYRFTPNSHRKQSLKLAFEQAKIGWEGCKMLDLPTWQYLAVAVPIFRAIFPPSISHLIYRSLSFFDPRKKQK